MKHRVFIAINLPEDIKKKVYDFRQKWDFLPVRWTKRDSLHLTLVFIGYVSDEEVVQICNLTKQLAAKHQPFFINFEKILYGPPLRQAQGKPPRMFWLKGKASEELSRIKKELENTLISSDGLGAFRSEHRPFSPHITLARIKMGEWHNLEKLPEIEQDFKAGFAVNSLEVMESDLKKDGAEYAVLESCLLGEKS